MNKIVFDWLSVAEFVVDEASLDVPAGTAMTVGVVDQSNQPLGGVLYHHYTGAGGSVTVHMAGVGRHWASRDFLWTVFDYAFNQMFVEKIFGPVPSDNIKSIDVSLKLGFTLEAKLEGVYHGYDQLIFSMTRRQCKWLNYKPRTTAAGFANLFRVFADTE